MSDMKCPNTQCPKPGTEMEEKGDHYTCPVCKCQLGNPNVVHKSVSQDAFPKGASW